MLTKEDARRVMIARVREWDTEVSGEAWYDLESIDHKYAFSMDDDFALANPEAGLDHG